MSVLYAVLFGAVQGVCSLMPISGMGHMAILANALGLTTEYSLFFAILLNTGTAIAVIVYYHRDVFRLITELGMIFRDLTYNAFLSLKGVSGTVPSRKLITNEYRVLLLLMLLAMAPTVLIGWFLLSVIEQIYCSVLAAAMGFFCTALLLYMTSFLSYSTEIQQKHFHWSRCLLVGLFHGFSCVPGFSRVTAALTACKMIGVRREQAVKFSLLMAVPTSIGALFLGMSKHLYEINFPGTAACISGWIVSAVVSWFVVRIAARTLERPNTPVFVGYCVLFGFLSVITYLL